MTQPLEGIRVLDFSQIAAGPYCSSILGDMGAEVIKIEKPGRGDEMRHIDRYFPGTDSSYFIGVNRNKRSLTLDLKHPAGKDLVRRLVARSDVTIENNRPGVMDRLGLGYADLVKVKPDLIYCGISAFGQQGPLVDQPGMDMVVQALSGLMGITGPTGGRPVKVGPPMGDFVVSYLGALGITLALRVRDRTGQGQRVDLSLLDGLIASMANYMTGYFVSGRPAGPVGSGHPQVVPQEVFATADRFIVVACLTEEFWLRFTRVLGREDLQQDARFRTIPDRGTNRAELLPILEAELRTRTADEWLKLLQAADVPCCPVHTLREAFAHPQVLENQMVVTLEHPLAGTVRVPGVPVKLSATPGTVRTPAPTLGQHTDEVLGELGLSAAEIARLKADGVV